MKHILSLLLIFTAIWVNAQVNDAYPQDTNLTKVLERRFRGGGLAFFKYMGSNLKYPKEARENCRVGILKIELKIRPTGKIDSLTFQNKLEIGMGIEEEVIRCIFSTNNLWTRDVSQSTLTFSIGFTHNERDKPFTSIRVNAFGSFVSECPSNDEIINQYRKAKSMDKFKKAYELCEELIRRTDADEYKKDLVVLKSKL